MSSASSAAITAHAGEPQARARAIIVRHSKSFSLAARLLPAGARDDAVLLYAYCRRVDDAIDHAAAAAQPGALAALRVELDAVYEGRDARDELLAAFQRLVHARAIPRSYPEELLAGMRMDVIGTRYATLTELLRYCHRVAGTVGLMMCHVMGVRRSLALAHAAHLGIAMQLTNIARDVLEDWERGRLYLPEDLLARHGVRGLHDCLGRELPASAVPAIAATVAALLDCADAYYRSADAGLAQLSLRCAFGVRAAQLIYAQIGKVVRARGCDPYAGRATVARSTKLVLVLRAAFATLLSAPRTLYAPRPRPPGRVLTLEAALPLRQVHP